MLFSRIKKKKINMSEACLNLSTTCGKQASKWDSREWNKGRNGDI